jgi:trigger factor
MLRRNLTQRLVDDNVFEVPPSLVDRELRRIIQDYGENMIQSGLDKEKVQESILENEEHLKKTASENIRLLYIIKAIGEREEFEATEEDVQNVIVGMAGRMGRTPEDILEEYTRDGALEELGFNVIREKVFKMLLDSAKITEMGAEEEEKPKKGKGKGKKKDK